MMLSLKASFNIQVVYKAAVTISFTILDKKTERKS